MQLWAAAAAGVAVMGCCWGAVTGVVQLVKQGLCCPRGGKSCHCQT
jgi:hypothetical protein